MEQLREKQRAHLNVPAEYNGRIGLLKDVSESGARIVVEDVKHLSEAGFLKITFLQGVQDLSLQVDLVWVDGNQLGLRFQSLKDKERFLIRKLVQQHRAES